MDQIWPIHSLDRSEARQLMCKKPIIQYITWEEIWHQLMFKKKPLPKMLSCFTFFQLCTVIVVPREKWTIKACFGSHCIALEFTVALTMLSYIFIVKIV